MQQIVCSMFDEEETINEIKSSIKQTMLEILDERTNADDDLKNAIINNSNDFITNLTNDVRKHAKEKILKLDTINETTLFSIIPNLLRDSEIGKRTANYVLTTLSNELLKRTMKIKNNLYKFIFTRLLNIISICFLFELLFNFFKPILCKRSC